MSARLNKELDCYAFEVYFNAKVQYWGSGSITVHVPFENPVYLHWDWDYEDMWEVKTPDSFRMLFPEVVAYLKAQI